MKLAHITFENYKAFQSPQAFNIKPITVIIGKNSAGKSVISRLPVLLARSLFPLATAPVEVQFDDLDFGGSFRDLIHNRFAHGNLRFQLVFEDGQKTLELEVVIQNVADSPLQIIAHFLIKSNEGFLLELNWHLAEPTNPFQTYQANGAIDGEVIVQFKGILPARIMRPTDESLINDAQLKSLIYEIWTATESINYLGPFRAPPKRTYVHKSSQLTNIGHQGEAAPHILGMTSLADTKKALVVGNWFAKNLGGWKLEVSTTHQDGFAIILISPTDSNVKINLMDVGLGINQVLPLVVRGLLGPKNSNGIDIIEQPELHLHPAAHGSLAWTATESINYLGPFRAPPKRTYVHKSSQLTNIGHQGEAAPHILGMTSLADTKKALVVGNWFAKNLGGWKLEVSTTHQDGFAIILISPTDSNVKINLMDVGLGINQVLPLVVRGLLGPKNSNGIDIIEQPELHLHPAAHGSLAELLVNTAKHENSRFIIETHSENFILRIRRLIAEGQLDCQHVIIYWVNNDDTGTTLKPISIDNEGEVDYWPKSVFTEDYQELIAIRKAQKNSKILTKHGG
jgi:predicted ATPase